MSIKISLDGANISGNSKLMNNASIKGNSVDIELTNLSLTDEANVFDSIKIDQSQDTQANHSVPANTEDPKTKRKCFVDSLLKHTKSICEGVASELISDAIKKR